MFFKHVFLIDAVYMLIALSLQNLILLVMSFMLSIMNNSIHVDLFSYLVGVWFTFLVMHVTRRFRINHF